MAVRVMTNPAELLLAGNPGKKSTRWKKGTKRATKLKHFRQEARVHALSKRERAEYTHLKSLQDKERPMAKKRKKSKASREKRIAKRREKRARRKAMPAGLRKYWAEKRAKKTSTPKRRKSRSKKTRMKKRRSRSRARRTRTRNVYASQGATVVVRKVKRGAVRRASRRRARGAKRVGVVGVNAGALSLTGGFTNFLPNVKATMKDGVKGFAFAFGGAAASVVGGSFTSQVTGNILGRFAPGLLANPVVSRLLGAVNYYLPGWAAAKFIPGLSGQSRRAMLTGAAAAALVEVIRPGMVRSVMQRTPIVGGLLGTAEDAADDLGAYVGYALNGIDGASQNNDGGDYAAVYEDNRGMDGMGEYLALGEYEQVDSDAAENVGVAGLGEYVRV